MLKKRLAYNLYGILNTARFPFDIIFIASRVLINTRKSRSSRSDISCVYQNKAIQIISIYKRGVLLLFHIRNRIMISNNNQNLRYINNKHSDEHKSRTTTFTMSDGWTQMWHHVATCWIGKARVARDVSNKASTLPTNLHSYYTCELQYLIHATFSPLCH